MRDNNRYKSTTGLQDLLFNNVVWLFMLLFIAMLLINPPTKKNDVEEKTEIQVVMTWPDRNDDDVDMYVRDPIGQVAWFQNKSMGFMHLDRDDTGRYQDTIVMADGTEEVVYINREVVSIRRALKGEYVVNIHMYSRKKYNFELGPLPIKVEVIQVNPYRIVYSGEKTLHKTGDEETMIRFNVDKDGMAFAKNDLFVQLVTDDINDDRQLISPEGYNRSFPGGNHGTQLPYAGWGRMGNDVDE